MTDAPATAGPGRSSDVMVDLETLGKTPGCVLRSIGAGAFAPKGQGLDPHTLYINIDRASCEAVGLTVDPDTVAWWDRQSDEAKAALVDNQVPLPEALDRFDAWFAQVRGRWLWCHGPSFDEPILRAAYAALGRAPPWRYDEVRCTRTAYAMGGNIRPDRTQGVHHTALDDVRAQVAAVQLAYRKLRLAPRPYARTAVLKAAVKDLAVWALRGGAFLAGGIVVAAALLALPAPK